MKSAEVFDPDTGTWTATGSMTEPRRSFTSTLLLDGRVLAAVVGIETTNPRTHMALDKGKASAEIYDPISGSWTLTRSMLSPHGWHKATRLADGRVLIISGREAEVYEAAPEHAGLLGVV
jgi:hypothetical protein